jgi:hypothetical protein
MNGIELPSSNSRITLSAQERETSQAHDSRLGEILTKNRIGLQMHRNTMHIERGYLFPFGSFLGFSGFRCGLKGSAILKYFLFVALSFAFVTFVLLKFFFDLGA